MCHLTLMVDMSCRARQKAAVLGSRKSELFWSPRIELEAATAEIILSCLSLPISLGLACLERERQTLQADKH